MFFSVTMKAWAFETKTRSGSATWRGVREKTTSQGAAKSSPKGFERRKVPMERKKLPQIFWCLGVGEGILNKLPVDDLKAVRSSFGERHEFFVGPFLDLGRLHRNLLGRSGHVFIIPHAESIPIQSLFQQPLNWKISRKFVRSNRPGTLKPSPQRSLLPSRGAFMSSDLGANRGETVAET